MKLWSCQLRRSAVQQNDLNIIRDIAARADDTLPHSEQDPPVVQLGPGGDYIVRIEESNLAPKEPGRVCRALRVLLGIE